jgi:hypothetical protein
VGEEEKFKACLVGGTLGWYMGLGSGEGSDTVGKLGRAWKKEC